MVLGAAAGAVASFSLRWRRRVRRATVHELGAWTATWLREYAPGSVLIANANGRPGFLQLALTARRRDRRRVEFGLPETGWSREHLPAVERVLDAAGVEWRIETNPGNPAVPRYLRATLEGTRAEVLERASVLLPELAAALGHPAHQSYSVELQGREDPEHDAELGAQLERLAGEGRLPRWLVRAVRRAGRL